MKRKSTIIIISSIIVVLFLSMILFSYGYYMTEVSGNSQSNKTSLSSQILSIVFDGGSESLTNSSDNTLFYPGTKLTKSFSVTNTGTAVANYSIKLKDVNNTFVRTQDITYEIRSNDVVLQSGVFPTSESTILYKESINVNETKNYTLEVNYLQSTENQIVDNGKSISANIYINENVKYFANLKIYGNSIQEDSEPGYLNAFSDLGENSKNLNKGMELGAIDSSGNNVDGNQLRSKEFIKVVSGSSYTVSNDKSYSISIYGYNQDKTFNSIIGTGTVTIPDGVKYVKLLTSVSQIDLNSKIQFELGSTATDYIPGKYIKINNNSKNMLDDSKIYPLPPSQMDHLEDGSIKLYEHPTYQFTRANSELIYVEANKTYTLSVLVSLTKSSGNSIIGIYKSDGTILKKIWVNGCKNRCPIVSTYTFEESGYIYITFYANYGAPNQIGGTYEHIMFEEGSVASEYEPYQVGNSAIIDMTNHEPLRASLNSYDYIDFSTSSIIRNVNRIVNNGEVGWDNSYLDSYNTLVYRSIIPIGKSGDYINNFNAGFSNISCNKIGIGHFSTNWATLNLGEYEESKLKNYFANQYNAGTPFIFQYGLATPKEPESIVLPKIDALKFTNNITACDSKLCASNIEAEYE